MINTWQLHKKLWKKQFPNVDGLWVTILSNDDIPCPPAQEAVQIHHIPGHWVMSCSFGGVVTVWRCKHHPDPSTEKADSTALQSLCSWTWQAYWKNCKICQNQIGGKDCGLFALVNALALFNGVDPATVKFQRRNLRQHLQQCLENQHFTCTMFPCNTSDPTSHTKRSRKDIVSLYCVCKRHYPE